MPRYLRLRLPGVPIFFTVALAQRGERRLVDHAGALREAVWATRAERPFGIGAWVVLPDHLHCIWVRRARKKVQWTFFSAERAKRRRQSRSYPR